MRTALALEALFLLLANLHHGLLPNSNAYLFVEGFNNAAKVSTRTTTLIHSRKYSHDPTFQSSTRRNMRQSNLLLGSSKTGNDSEVIANDPPSTNSTWKSWFGLRMNDAVSDFVYGANYVNSQYLSILWKYSIVKTFKWTVPIAIALWLNHGLYDSFIGMLRSILAISSAAATLLRLPVDFCKTILLSVWNIPPEAISAAIMILPGTLAIPLVQVLLLVRGFFHAVVDACCQNTWLISMLAVLVWRPAIEEWQYRSVLDKLLFGVPRWLLAKGQAVSPSTIDKIKSIKDSVTARIGRNETAIVESEQNEDDFAPFLPDESTRILLGSFLFATTRLGWLSTDPADAVALSNSPYGFTIGFLQSLGSLVSEGGVQRDLRLFLLLLAVHQTISTFFVAQHVFAGIYRRKGLAASVGAHVSWTIGKGTIPFRLVGKVWQSTRAKLAGSTDTSIAGDSDTSSDVDEDPSVDDNGDETTE